MVVWEMDQGYTDTIQFQMIVSQVSQHLLQAIFFLVQELNHLFQTQLGA